MMIRSSLCALCVAALTAVAAARLPVQEPSAVGGDPAGPSTVFDPRALPRAEPGIWAAMLDPERIDEARAAFGPDAARFFTSAQQFYGRRNYPAALDALRRCLVDAAEFPPALQLLGTVFFRLQRYGDAAVCFERFIAHAPGEVWRTQALGHAYYSLGDYAAAREHYARVLAALPEGADPEVLVEARRGLALAHWRTGDTERALTELRTVVEQRPEHAEAWTWIGQIEFEEGSAEVALEALEKARKLTPYEPRPWYLLSQVYFELGFDEKADAARERWKDIDRITQEVRSAEARLELDPRNYDLAQQLVELQKTLGNTDGIRRALDALLAARPGDLREVDVRVYVLETLVRIGDFAGAEVAAAALEERCSDEPETWKRLESYYGRIGDSRRQIEAGERYLRVRSR